MRYSVFLALAAFFLLKTNLICGQVLGGSPFYRHFSTDDFGGENQVWRAVQGKDGSMYFGNNQAVIVYDGASWKAVPTNNNSNVRGLHVAPDGTVYVGGKATFGYLGSDKKGGSVFIPLMPKAEKPLPAFAEVSSILSDAKNNVYFFLGAVVFVWDGKKSKTIMPHEEKGRIGRGFYVNGEVYASQSKIGLCVLKNGKFEPIPGGDYFMKNALSIADMKERPDGKILIMNPTKGFFLYTPEKIAPAMPPEARVEAFPTDLDQKLTTVNTVQSFTELKGGRYAVGLKSSGGITIIGGDGKFIEHYGKENAGLKAAVYNSYQDDKGGLWLGTSAGIDYFETESPFRVYPDDYKGYEGAPLSMIRHKGVLYMSTAKGLYKMENGVFVLLPNSPSDMCWKFFYFQAPEGGEKKLMAVCSSSVVEIDGWNGACKVISDKGGFDALQSIADPTRIYIATQTGMAYIERKNWAWSKSEPLTNVKFSTRYLAEDKKGAIWATSDLNGVFRLQQTVGKSPSDFTTVNFDTLRGLPEMDKNNVYQHDGRVVFGTKKGFYKFDDKSQTFSPDLEMERATGNAGRQLQSFVQDKNGGYWTVGNQPHINPFKRSMVLPGGGVKTDTLVFKRLPNMEMEFIYPDENGDVWLGGSGVLVSYNPNVAWEANRPFKALISKVSIHDEKPIYEGFQDLAAVEAFQAGFKKTEGYVRSINPVLKYADNSLTFYAGAIAFDNSAANRFSFFLEGYDQVWSEWTDDNKKEYTNLSNGKYTLRVKARNIYGEVSETASYPFQVLPPWHKTVWAYILYFIAGGVFVFGIVKWNTRRLKKEKERLEELVRKRTAEISKQNQELEIQKDEILTKNSEIQGQKDNIEKQKHQIEKAYNNIHVISDIGKKISAVLDLEDLIRMVYQNVNELMDANAFGIGIYNPKEKQIDFKGAIEQGITLPFHWEKVNDSDSLAVWCFKNNKDILINDMINEYSRYSNRQITIKVGVVSQSLIYLPLVIDENPIGVLTVQSNAKNAYSEREITILGTLASYISIAIDNANAYEIIKTTNKSITDSIRYAQTIQNAILPSLDKMDRVLQNFFLIYRPQKIVSGDFYWFAHISADGKVNSSLESLQVGEKAFVAVVDCTGHGVPGAFMSMIGNTLLNEVVNHQHLYDTSKALEALDEMFKEILRQGESDNDDGMDACFCMLEKSRDGETKVVFTGAKRPLYCFKNDQKQVWEFKGDNKSIGGVHRRDRAFTKQELLLAQGDAIYLTTDGLVDQNNPEREKFGTVKLKTALKDFGQAGMEEQKNKLETIFDEHKEMTEQRDDITVIGIKI